MEKLILIFLIVQFVLDVVILKELTAVRRKADFCMDHISGKFKKKEK